MREKIITQNECYPKPEIDDDDDNEMKNNYQVEKHFFDEVFV